jgi:hypothetical protein
MNSALLLPEVQEFIQKHLSANLKTLVFKKSPFPEVSMAELVQQITAKQKAEKKLPQWFAAKNIIYPEKISLEQTSSEKTAEYKAGLVSGNRLADLTGGFGVDDFYLAKKFKEVFHVEKNTGLSQIAQWNFKQLGVTNISSHQTDAISFLKANSQHYDWIYADPSRRDDQKNRVFLFSDCTPDIPGNLALILTKTNRLLIKSSPLIDLHQGLKELKHVKEIHIVALKNEVKELLWILENPCKAPVTITCVNLEQESNAVFSFKLEEETEAEVSYSPPLKYLYEPNNAILKSGAFKTIAVSYALFKIGVHSHLYTSESPVSFPGRIFGIQEVLPFHKKELKKRFSKTKAHITTRNFPWPVNKLRRELKIDEGGDLYLFFTTDLSNKHLVIICKKY